MFCQKCKTEFDDCCPVCGLISSLEPMQITKCSKCLNYYNSLEYNFCPSCALWEGLEDET